MRAHIKRAHQATEERIEFILAKCEVSTKENRGYLDPGLYTYRGTTLGHTTSEIQETPIPDVAPVEPKPPAGSCTPVLHGLQEDTMDEQTAKKRKLTLDEYKAREPYQRNSHQENLHTEGTQTTWHGLPSIQLPALPEAGNREELQACLMWLCNGMDVLGRTRELVKRRLEDGDCAELQRERALWRQLERRNRELEREVRKLQERDSLFEE
jgi:hypothetical protein